MAGFRSNSSKQILNQEIDFIKNDLETPLKRVQVKWQGEAAKWYPIAAKLLRQLVTDPDPVEFATQLLLPFTFDFVGVGDPGQRFMNYRNGRLRDEIGCSHKFPV